DARLNLSKQVADEAKEYFGSQMFGITIPRNVRLAEAPSFGKPILLYDVQSVGAKSYLAVAQELIRRVERTGAAAPVPPPPAPPAPEPLPEVPAGRKPSLVAGDLVGGSRPGRAPRAKEANAKGAAPSWR